MKSTTILFFTVAALTCSILTASDELFEANVRIKASDGGIGSGCVYKQVDGQSLIITNHHVAGGKGSRVQVEFWRSGKAQPPVQGKVIWDRYKPGSNLDMAVVTVNHTDLGFVPPLVPMAEQSLTESGKALGTVGCPEGKWPTGFTATIQGNDRGLIRFSPPPANGRSGSVVLDQRGLIVGLIAWRDDATSTGLAMPVEIILKAFRGEVSDVQKITSVLPVGAKEVGTHPIQDCPDGDCPDNGWGTLGLFGGRRPQQPQPPLQQEFNFPQQPQPQTQPQPQPQANQVSRAELLWMQQVINGLDTKIRNLESQLAVAEKTIGKVEAVSVEQSSLREKVATLREISSGLLNKIETVKAVLPDSVEAKIRGAIIAEVMDRVNGIIERKGFDKEQVIEKARAIFAAMPAEWQNKLNPVIKELRDLKSQMESDLEANKTSLVETAKSSAVGAVKGIVINAVKEHAGPNPIVGLAWPLVSAVLGGAGIHGVFRLLVVWLGLRRDQPQPTTPSNPYPPIQPQSSTATV